MDQQQVLNQQQIQPVQPAIQGNNDAANLARQIQANTNVTMKTEVVKLPDFYGDPAKDTVTALEFMARIDECQITNEWNDITTFSYFLLALRSQADKWLSSVVRHLQLTPAQKTWTRIRPMFKTEFAAFSDDKLIIDGLAKLSHRPGENPRMFFSRLEELIFVLKENYASYRVKPDRPAQEAGGGYSDASLTKAINDNVDNFANFMFTQMFKAATPENVRQLSQRSNQAHSGGCLQSFFHRPQAGDGQKGLTDSCCIRRSGFHKSETTTRRRSFQTSAKATKQATTEFQQ